MRNKYIEMRKSNSFDLKWFYEFYNQNFDSKKHKPYLPFHIFSQIFGIYLQQTTQQIFDYLDKYFEVQYIENENGKIIYMV